MKQVNRVGVDVDSEALVCMMKRAGQALPLATFANTAAGHKKFIRWATKGGHPARVCLEATGIHSLEFALALHERGAVGNRKDCDADAGARAEADAARTRAETASHPLETRRFRRRTRTDGGTQKRSLGPSAKSPRNP